MPVLQPPIPTPTAPFVPPVPGQPNPWRLSQGLKTIERGAAAKGTLLTGGLQSRLMEFGQGLASQDYGNDYQRALQTYTTNRDTGALNYGQARTGYQDSLDAMPAPSYLPSSYGPRPTLAVQPDAQQVQADRLQREQRQSQMGQLDLEAQRQHEQHIEDDRLRADQHRSQIDQLGADAERNRLRMEQDRAVAQQALANANAQPRSWSEPETPRPFVLSQSAPNPMAAAQAAQGPENERLRQQYMEIVARLERQQQEAEARRREEAARTNTAYNAVKPAMPYLPQYYPRVDRRVAGASA